MKNPAVTTHGTTTKEAKLTILKTLIKNIAEQLYLDNPSATSISIDLSTEENGTTTHIRFFNQKEKPEHYGLIVQQSQKTPDGLIKNTADALRSTGVESEQIALLDTAIQRFEVFNFLCLNANYQAIFTNGTSVTLSTNAKIISHGFMSTNAKLGIGGAVNIEPSAIITNKAKFLEGLKVENGALINTNPNYSLKKPAPNVNPPVFTTTASSSTVSTSTTIPGFESTIKTAFQRMGLAVPVNVTDKAFKETPSFQAHFSTKEQAASAATALFAKKYPSLSNANITKNIYSSTDKRTWYVAFSAEEITKMENENQLTAPKLTAAPKGTSIPVKPAPVVAPPPVFTTTVSSSTVSTSTTIPGFESTIKTAFQRMGLAVPVNVTDKAFKGTLSFQAYFDIPKGTQKDINTTINAILNTLLAKGHGSATKKGDTKSPLTDKDRPNMFYIAFSEAEITKMENENKKYIKEQEEHTLLKNYLGTEELVTFYNEHIKTKSAMHGYVMERLKDDWSEKIETLLENQDLKKNLETMFDDPVSLSTIKVPVQILVGENKQFFDLKSTLDLLVRKQNHPLTKETFTIENVKPMDSNTQTLLKMVIDLDDKLAKTPALPELKDITPLSIVDLPPPPSSGPIKFTTLSGVAPKKALPPTPQPKSFTAKTSDSSGLPPLN
jgi:hypothetical protein